MAWLLLALFIGIGCLFAISSCLDAPSSPNTIPIPEDTASERPLISRTTNHTVRSELDSSIVEDIDPRTGDVHVAFPDDLESAFDDSNSFDDFNSFGD